jgi:hypothetical protein
LVIVFFLSPGVLFHRFGAGRTSSSPSRPDFVGVSNNSPSWLVRMVSSVSPSQRPLQPKQLRGHRINNEPECE